MVAETYADCIAINAGKKKVHKLRLSVEDLMAGGDPERKGQRKSVPPKRKRSPSPTTSATPKPSTPVNTGAAKRKSMRPTIGKKFKGEDDSDDLTRDMEDPPSDNNLREVEMPKPSAIAGSGIGGISAGGGGASNTKKDSDWMPTKGC